jgi:hypothetical protein
MICHPVTMPRKRRSYILDERVIDAIASLANQRKTSANRCLEEVLFFYSQQMGLIPSDAERLGETRGGDRTASKGEDDEST